MTNGKKHVVIIGAGISGLAAAHELSKHPSLIQVTVLEARNRIGGRLDTHRNLVQGEHEDIPIDFGASWIHGVDPSNPIVSLAETAQARLEATNSDVIYHHPGQPALKQDESNHYWAVLWEIFGKAQEFSRDNRNRISVHTSFRNWLDHYLSTRQSRDPALPNYMSPRERKIIPLLAQFWADENAIALNKVSLKYMDAENMPPGDHCIMANGYDRVLDVLCEEMKSVPILLEHVVDRIEYNESNVKISTSKGVFTADVVLVTLPLGVLKSGSVAFSPPLPERKKTAIKRLGFGTMVKVVLYFPICFWPKDKHFINFLPIPSSIPNPKLCRHLNERQMAALTTYMNDLANYTSLMPVHNAPIMIAYAANESAEVFEKLTEQEAMEVLVCQLSHYFPILVKDPANSHPTRVFMTRWYADPYARGSYTSIPVGAHQSDLGEFEIPVGARSVTVLSSSEYPETEDKVDTSFALKAAARKHQIMMMSYDKRKPIAKSGHENYTALGTSPTDSNEGFPGNLMKGCLLPSQDKGALHSINMATNSAHCLQHVSILGLAKITGENPASHRASRPVSHPRIGSMSEVGHRTSIPGAIDIPNHRLHRRQQSNDTGRGHYRGFDDAIDIAVGSGGNGGSIMGGLVAVATANFDRNNHNHHVHHRNGIQDQPSARAAGLFLSEMVEPLMPSFPAVFHTKGSSPMLSSTSASTSTSPPSIRKKQATPPTAITVVKTIGVNDAAKGRIYFAGEHTTATSFASVHGALMTGRREAAKIFSQTF
ncbi:hypothetical protein BGZ97_000091 [Linnemannia gamsii]|uniref:Amine oxidase domain-containing protein n=1 Tax=Linnemannia gamsii TaxID=64522 RepID=A0A9P6R346_9FUNG|nr:hypothetical protein BGZ97_000091 [Linnemannia gamsii]